MHARRWFAAAIVCAVAGSSLAVAAQKPNVRRKAAADPDMPQLTWPLPPEPPRVRYVATYRGVTDFKPAKRPSRLAAMLLGAADTSAALSDAMLKPYAVAVGPTGRMYVSDTAARRVFAFDIDRRIVGFVGEGRTGRLTKPVGVAVDGRGVVFVSDSTLKRVFGYGLNGETIIAIGHEGELEGPSGLAVDRGADRLYVVDAGRHQVLCYSTRDGSLVSALGKRGGAPGEFNFPTNVAVDNDGKVYVTDTLNFRIQIFDRDGRFVRTFGEIGDSPGRLNRPKGIAVDSEGHIYVADSSFNNFQVFDQDGRLLLFVGQGGNLAGEFALPAGLYIDARDRIYVADQGNSRVQVFQYVKSTTNPRAGEGASQ